jgi:hypothetical protein
MAQQRQPALAQAAHLLAASLWKQAALADSMGTP